MTPRISESSFAVIGDMMPPRDPNDDEEDEDENSDDKARWRYVTAGYCSS